MVLSSSLVSILLSTSTTQLSAPHRYSNLKLNPAKAETQRCPVASKFGVVSMYMSGLLSVHMVKGWYIKYSLNCCVTAHLRVRNSNFDEWQLASLPCRVWLAYATGWYFPSSCTCCSMAPKPYLDASVSSRKGLFRSAKANTGAVAHFFFNI